MLIQVLSQGADREPEYARVGLACVGYDSPILRDRRLLPDAPAEFLRRISRAQRGHRSQVLDELTGWWRRRQQPQADLDEIVASLPMLPVIRHEPIPPVEPDTNLESLEIDAESTQSVSRRRYIAQLWLLEARGWQPVALRPNWAPTHPSAHRYMERNYSIVTEGRVELSPTLRLAVIRDYVAYTEYAEGTEFALQALERALPIIEQQAPHAPRLAFDLYAWLGLLRELSGADRAAVEAYRGAIAIGQPEPGRMTDLILMEYRLAGVLHRLAADDAVDALHGADRAFRMENDSNACISERMVSLAWGLSELYNSRGMRRQGRALREFVISKEVERWRTRTNAETGG